MPHSRSDEERTQKEAGKATLADSADEQEQDGPATKIKRTLLEHCEDAMNEHETLGTRLAQ